MGYTNFTCTKVRYICLVNGMKASPSKGEKERMDYCIIEMKGQEKNITSIRCFYFMDQKSIPSKKIEV